MFSHIMIGTNDLAKAKTFYDAVLGDLGGKRTWTMDRIQFYGSAERGPMVAICRPYDEKPATSGNGTMTSLAAPSRELVDKTHAMALASGGKDEGAPGLRGETFYGAYFRDLDGNKLCVFHMG